jgi:hypothetical protein
MANPFLKTPDPFLLLIVSYLQEYWYLLLLPVGGEERLLSLRDVPQRSLHYIAGEPLGPLLQNKQKWT